MSNYDEGVLAEQLHILRDFLFHYASFKCINAKFDNLIKYGSQEFWIFTINAHYFQAINLWCMIFGTNKNETHWRKLGLMGEFKSTILSELDLNENDYDAYWNSLIDWRNKYTAHRVPGFLKPTPDLKTARRVALLYEEWIAANIDIIIDFSLESYEEEFNEQLEESFNILLPNSSEK